MTDETGSKETATDGDNVADETKNDNETKEPKETKSVSFNKDVHVKRFGKPRELRGTSSEKQPLIRKEPFTHLSERELLDEANKVIAQAESVSCTADHPPEKFFSLPHRRKFKEDRSDRRNCDDSTDTPTKSTLGRSTSDVGNKRRKERTSLSTLFRRAQKTKTPDTPVAVTTKPKTTVKRSKSDVSDLKSNTNLYKPIRKRSGSETEEFLKSLRNKKTQLSPIIESSPREDYFKRTPPLEVFQKQKLAQKDSTKSDDNISSSDYKKVNPVEKPPRYKSPEKTEPTPPVRTKRGKSAEKDKEDEPSITETPKRKTDVKKTFLVDEIDSVKAKDIRPLEVKERIKDQIRKLEENIYGDKEMIHSSQQPPDKPPLTRGNTVDHIVRILKNDKFSPPPHLISSTGATNVNQPFSYTKPSVSPDPNLFTRTTDPERVPTPVNKMPTEEVVYAKVVKDLGLGDTGPKKPVRKTYSPSREYNRVNISDEDEGLGYEDRYKYSPNRDYYNYQYKNNDDDKFNSFEGYKITDSPIKPGYREYKLTTFANIEPTYANADEYPNGQDISHHYINTFRGRGDGMDTRKSPIEVENNIDLEFNELSHRRQLLESRLNARRSEREKTFKAEPMPRYISEVVPSYEADKRKATEKFVNETLRYRHTLERDGYTENSIIEDYSKHDSNTQQKIKYNTETKSFQKAPKGEIDRREFINHLASEPKHVRNRKDFPPEPEYEPPSLEFVAGKPMKSPDELKEKKYKVKKQFTSSHDVENGKYKVKDENFGKRKGHYASNPEIVGERDDDYVNIHNNTMHTESYHDSLRRVKNKDKFYKGELGVKRHDSGDSREYYYDDRSPRRFEIDNRLVDSGIENDFRKESSGDIHRRHIPYESDEDVRNTSMLLASERRHTEDNYPSEQIYANGEYVAKFKDYNDDFITRERRDGSHLDSKHDKYNRSRSRPDDKVSAKPPKATKKLSGLEKVKQLFSRDSSKKSKKEKEATPSKNRTRVLKSPEHLDRDDSEYKRYTDPEPSDLDDRKTYDPKLEERRYRSSREDLDRRGSNGRDSDIDRKKKQDCNSRYERTMKEERRFKSQREEKRRHHSSDRESDRISRPSDAENELRKSRSTTAGPTKPLDSPALAERYRERRRLATPSPTPSPPRRQPEPPATSGWFKSLERIGRKRGKTSSKVEKESVITTEGEPRKTWSKPVKPLNSPAKNLRFFGDTDQDSDATTKNIVTKSRSHPSTKTTLRKTTSNSSTGLDEVDHALTSKSYSLTNLHKNDKQYRRNLHNISEIQSNSEAESQIGKNYRKPPINPYDRSRSHSSSKTLKGSKADVRRYERSEERGSSELRGSKQELSRDTKHRRRTPATNSGESSTEGDSSHQSQRSVVYLHATTVGDIPNPDRLTRNRSRDDVSSVNSSNLQVRSTTKSFSIFAPWTPRHYSNERDVHYSQRSRSKPREFKKASSTKNLAEERPNLQKNKSYSQTTLTRRPQNSRLTSSSTTLYRKPEKRTKENDSVLSTTRRSEKRGDSIVSSTLKPRRDDKRSQSSEILNRDDRDRVSRSISMPKDGKKAGWFKLTNKNKKQELNTRVR